MHETSEESCEFDSKHSIFRVFGVFGEIGKIGYGGEFVEFDGMNKFAGFVYCILSIPREINS
jgi:hypothetical protein